MACWIAAVSSAGDQTLPPQSGEAPGAIAITTPLGSLFARVAAESSLVMGVARTLVALSEASKRVDQLCCMMAYLFYFFYREGEGRSSR